jgi:arylsulfatase A-like enzyme
MGMKEISFRQFFRLIFVTFSLYLMGDAFYRWDGFRYHSSFPEFIPGLALALILWSVVAILTAVLIWILLRAFEWICRSVGFDIKVEYILLCVIIFIIFGALTWEGKKFLWPDMNTTKQMKLIVLISVLLLSMLIAWLFRDKAQRWIAATSEHITPLVWLFGIAVLISVPLVTYQLKFKDEDKGKISQKINSVVSDKKRPNILLVTFDALAAEDMSVYGYDRPTTPFINEWSKTATLFTNLHAASNWTTPTTASLMTGKRLWTHRAAHLSGAPPLKSNIESLPLLLKENGYFNMAFVTNPLASAKRLGIANSFDISPSVITFSIPRSFIGDGAESIGEIDKLLYMLFADKIKDYNWIISEDFILRKLLSLIMRDVSLTTTPPEKAFNELLTVLDSNPPEPYFAWIHIYPPHIPYLPPATYLGMFDDSLELRTYNSQRHVYDSRTKYYEYERFPEEIQPSIDTLRARYDEFIRYCDKEFEDFIKRLTEKNKLDNTVIILSADHGQSFEHAYLAHMGPHLYEQVTNIPLIIKVPMQGQGLVINELADQVDIPATIADFTGIPAPSWMEGSSLVPLMLGNRLTSKATFSMNLDKNKGLGMEIKKGTFAVWEGDYKLIHYLEENRSLLYNLKADHNEMNNIFDKKSETGKHLLDLIYENLKNINKKSKKEN